MLIHCPKCRKSFDPATQMAHCSAHYGHAPVKATDQNLSDALLTTKEKQPPRSSFQSDFMLIWDEPAKYRYSNKR